MGMRYGSVCSGVEAATVAWHPLGWKPQWFSEVEPFPSAVLAHHYPNTINHGDMTNFKEWKDDPIDLLVGGTPCQSFSVAGLRKGLDDPRGNLMLTYLAIAARYSPKWLVWENVPGVLSSNGGRDFGTFLGALGELGYGFAYRVLDAQYFGVAQRRRRVFVVGYLGDWRRAAAVLFERESLSGHPAPSREAREEVAQCLTTRTGQRYDAETETLPIAFGAQNSANQGDSVSKHVTPTLDKSKTPAVAFSSKDYGADALDDLSPTLRAGGHDKSHANAGVPPAVAFDMRGRDGGSVMEGPHDTANIRAASGGSSRSYIAQPMAVRRLTPRECERLQGFPDDYTLIPYRNKLAADGPRYKAMGNSMAVPVMRWIGRKIDEVDSWS
jgi:DNA (cytosine-5)-methyltransferase 1